MNWDLLVYNLNIANPDHHNSLKIQTGMAIAIKGEKIAAIMPVNELPDDPKLCAELAINMNGMWATPGLIDCHTHLVFAGNRSNEFEQRLEGLSYQEISQAGGGILSTVKSTRTASREELISQSEVRLENMLVRGITTVEIKSGYGLDTATEIQCLEVARRLGERHPVRVLTTFLGAHALPAEFQTRQEYIQYICDEMLPEIAEKGLADAVDGFCETIAFDNDQIQTLFDTAKKLELPLKLHADQLSNSHAALLAAHNNALSADHLEFTSESSFKAMQQSGTVPVLLPGAFYFLQETKKPDIATMRALDLPMAVASDCNPGSSPISNPLLILNMACTCFGLTPAEALCGMTKNAAKALGIDDITGSLEAGKIADIAFWKIDQPVDLCYWMGSNPCSAVIQSGQMRDIQCH